MPKCAHRKKNGWRDNGIEEFQSQFQTHVFDYVYRTLPKRLSRDGAISHGHVVSGSRGCVCKDICVKTLHEEHGPNPAILEQTWGDRAVLL